MFSNNEESLIYNPELLDYIQYNVSLLKIVDSYYKIHDKEHSSNKENCFIKVYPNGKFFYNCCYSHYNSSECFAFFVDERKQLYYCLGCGTRGSVFDFINECYNLDINETTELLGAIINIFDFKMLNNKIKEIYNELKLNYDKQNELFEESERKTKYINNRVELYLKKLNLEKIDYQKVANRLCCSDELVRKIYLRNKVEEKQKEDSNMFY